MAKKSYLKTMEILFVVILTVVFLAIIIPRQYQSSESVDRGYLSKLEGNDIFRAYVMDNDICFNSSKSTTITPLISHYLPPEISYVLCTGPTTEDLPDIDVYLDTLFFAGNITKTRFKTIRLYYWYS